MEWTKKRPTSDGWYWCKCRGTLTGKTYETPVKVYNGCLTVFWDGENFNIDCDSFLEWSSVEIPPPGTDPVGQASVEPQAESEKIALIDMDGTVADYDGHLSRSMDAMKSPGDPTFESFGWDRDSYPPYIQERMKLVKSQPGWWEKIPVLPCGIHIVNALDGLGFRLHVLTQGPKYNSEAWSQKANWVMRNMPSGTPITITRDKGLVYGKVLVDDWPEYVVRWLQWRPRGKVIMVAHPWNKDFKHPNVFRYSGESEDDELVRFIKS